MPRLRLKNSWSRWWRTNCNSISTSRKWIKSWLIR